MPRDCTGRGYFNGMISPHWCCGSHKNTTNFDKMVKQRAKRFLQGAGKQSKELAAQARKIGAQVNKLDRYLGGTLSANPISGTAMMAGNAAVGAMDYFGELTEDLLGSAVAHPGVLGGMVAGVANGALVRNRRARVTGSKGTIRIMHKELIATCVTANSLAPHINNGISLTSGSSPYNVNAMSRVSFPWLASIAGNYDQYRFKRLRLVYVPLCPTSTFGRASLVYDPDSSDTIPADRVGLSNMACAAEGPIWGQIKLDVKLSDTNKWYYGATSSIGTTIGAYLNQGQFAFCTYGTGSAIDCGEVYAVYDVELKDPQPSTMTISQAHGNAATVTTGFDTTAGLIASSSTTAVAILFATPGTYYVLIHTTATANSAYTTTGNITIIDSNRWNATTEQIGVAFLRVNQSGSTLTLPGLTGLAAWDIIVADAPANVNSGILT